MTEAEVVARYAPLVWGIALRRGWFLPGAEVEDLAQEGFIGLLKAARDYRPSEGPFGAFAGLCIERAMVTALVTANRAKHQPLTGAARVIANELGELEAADQAIADPRADVPAQVETSEALRAVLRACEGLSKVERRAVLGLAWGYSCAELGGIPNARGQYRQLDNGAQRARRKLRAAA